MKLFEFWTELPAGILSMFPGLCDELNQFSQMIGQWSKKILVAQQLVVEQLNKIQMNDLSPEALDSLHQKLFTIEKEKSNLAIQGIKATTKILSKVSNFWEGLDCPSMDNMTQMKLILKITRTIKEKIDIETGDLKMKLTDISTVDLSSNSAYLCSIPNSINNNGVEFFFNMLFIFVDKIQSKLFSKSNQFLTILDKSRNTQEVDNLSDSSSKAQESRADEKLETAVSENNSVLEVNRNYLVSVKQTKAYKIVENSKIRKLNMKLDNNLNDGTSNSFLRRKYRKRNSTTINKKKTSYFSYQSVSSSDSTADYKSIDLDNSNSEEVIEITKFRVD